MDIAAYIYLLQDGEYTGTNVYKVGRTVQRSGDTRVLRRLKQYNRWTIVENTFRVRVDQVNEIETNIKRLFRDKYRLVRGTEWFEGDVDEMYEDISTIINDYKKRHKRCDADDKSSITYSDIYSVLLKEMWAELSRDLNAVKPVDTTPSHTDEVGVSTQDVVTPTQEIVTPTTDDEQVCDNTTASTRTCPKCGNLFNKPYSRDKHLLGCKGPKSYVKLNGKYYCRKCNRASKTACDSDKHYKRCKVGIIEEIDEQTGLSYIKETTSDKVRVYICKHCSLRDYNKGLIIKHTASCIT